MKNLLFSMIAMGLLGGCAAKVKILDTAAVSTKHYSISEGQKLEETGDVTGQFCADSTEDEGEVGLMDKAVSNTLSENNIDFITNASFYSKGNCTMVEGTGAVIK